MLRKTDEKAALTFVCVKWGNKYSVDYVNNLFAAVARNFTRVFDFICYTDDVSGVRPEVTCLPLPSGEAEGWWNKLYLFSQKFDGRVCFLDLDTLIVDNIDFLANYRGKFAILRDFYRQNGYGSGVMVWKDAPNLWESWIEDGKPVTSGGDQEYIENKIKNADRLQDLFPKRIYSYKKDCVDGAPLSAAIICFHGKPDPHEVLDTWVGKIWNDRIDAPLAVRIHHNKSDVVEKNIKSCIKRNLPEIKGFYPPKFSKIAIVGGSPSLAEQVETIRKFKGYILACNGAYDFLVFHGIRPNGFIMLDSRDENVRFVQKPSNKTDYFIASCCSPLVFNKLKKQNVIVWHSDNDIYNPADKFMVGGGCTVGTRAICLATILGFSDIELFGMDSCYFDDSHHAYKQPLNDSEKVIDVIVGDKQFKAAIWMAGQAQDFKNILANFGHMFDIKVHGNGLLAAILEEAWKLYRLKEQQDGII